MGIFFFGSGQVQTPFGDGFLCVGTVTRLLPAIVSSAGGAASRSLDLTLPPAAGVMVPGATTNFQFWYRDPASTGAGFNLTNGLSVLWQ